jgi:hypothetical protein
MSVKELKNKIQDLEDDLQFEKDMRDMYKRRLEECEVYSRPLRNQENKKMRKAINNIRATPNGKKLLNSLFTRGGRRTRKSRR